MGKIRRFIARLFNIQPEDLQRPEFQKQTNQAAPYTREEIIQLVKEQVSEMIIGENLAEEQEALG